MTGLFRCAACGARTALHLVQPTARRRTGTTSTLAVWCAGCDATFDAVKADGVTPRAFARSLRPSLRRRLAVVAVALASILGTLSGVRP